MIRRLSPVFFLCAVLAGCGGGGSSSSALPQGQPTSAAPTGVQSVVVSILIPPAASSGSSLKRRPLYISQNTQSAAISVNGGTPVVANLAPGSPNCPNAAPGGGRTCSITISAPVGNDTFSETTYASTNGTGTPLSLSTTTVPISAGKANVVTLTLQGIVSSIALSLANSSPPVGIATSIGLTVTFKDASGATIIGNDPFANPITLTDSDATGATKIVPLTRLNSPADAAQLSVAYSGAALSQATFSASAAGVVASNITPATLTPTAATSFVDWASYGYDVQRTGFNPYTTGITPTSLGQLHVAWQIKTGNGQQTQPIVITNIGTHQALLIVAAYHTAQAYDALTGGVVWQRSLPIQSVQDCGTAGISGTAAYDKALGAIFMVAGNGGTDPNHTLLYKLDASNGAIIGQVDVTPTLEPGEANYSHAGVTFANGRVYVGTGSDCEGTATGLPSWRGRVVAVDPSLMTIQKTFFVTWGQGGNFGGGGVWSWGGVSADANGSIYVSTGNAETDASTNPVNLPQPPFDRTTNEQAGYSEQLIKLSADLSKVLDSNYPGFDFNIGYGDLDYTGTPVIYQPPLQDNCGTLSATQGKGGTLVINNTAKLSPASHSFALSVPSATAYYIGNPAYSPNTDLLYAAITSGNSSMLLPGLAAISNCGTSIAWHAQFGPDSSQYNTNLYGPIPRSAPTVTAGGVVFMGTPCTPDGAGGCGAPGLPGGALWAVDGSSGTVLGGAKPVLITAAPIRMAPSADGLWTWLLDDGGNLYGMTVDPSVKAIVPQAGRRATPTLRIRHR